MDFGVLIEVAIGLAAIYFLLAIACSFVVEGFNSYANVRGRALELFVREMIVGAAPTGPREHWLRRLWSRLARGVSPSVMRWDQNAIDFRILEHPLIAALKKPVTEMKADSTPPSYIPSELFAKAVLDRIATWIAPLSARRQDVESALTAIDAALAAAQGAKPQALPHDGLQAIRGALDDVLDSNPGPTISLLPLLVNMLNRFNETPDLRARVSAQVAAVAPQGVLATVASAVDVLSAVLAQPARVGASPGDSRLPEVLSELALRLPRRDFTFQELKTIVQVNRLPGPLGESLRAMVHSANRDLNEVKLGIERWYDSVMDRATGWFKRRATVVLGCVGFVVAAAFNIDSFDIATHLVKDPAARAAGTQLGQYIASLPPERAASMPQQTAFHRAIAEYGWDARAKDENLQKRREAAEEMQKLLLVMGEALGPMMGLQMLARDEGADAKRWGDMVQAVGAAACRARLGRMTPDETKARSEIAAALEKRPADFLKDPLCTRELAAFNPVGDQPAEAGKAFDMPKAVSVRKQRVCDYWNSAGLALSWSPEMAVSAWSLIGAADAKAGDAKAGTKAAAKAGDAKAADPKAPATKSDDSKAGTSKTGDTKAGACESKRDVSAAAFSAELERTKKEAEKTRQRIDALVDRLPNVGLITTVGPKRKWWETCDPKLADEKQPRECRSPKPVRNVTDLLPAALVILLGVWLCFRAFSARRGATANVGRLWAAKMIATVMALLTALVLIAGHLLHAPESVQHGLAVLLVISALSGLGLALYEATRDQASISMGAFAFFLLLTVAMLPIVYFGIYNIAHTTLLMAACGWAVTGVMISYGAPFWYELLNKLVNQRVTGPKPKPTPAA